MKFTIPTEFTLVTCASCSKPFAIIGDRWVCPYCSFDHGKLSQEIGKLREEIKTIDGTKVNLQRLNEFSSNEIDRLQKTLSNKDREEVKRASLGVCPICGDTVRNVKTHLNLKHGFQHK